MGDRVEVEWTEGEEKRDRNEELWGRGGGACMGSGVVGSGSTQVSCLIFLSITLLVGLSRKG